MLPDVLKNNLLIVFCGTAVGDTSARLGQYYAGPGNKFWKILCEVRLTPILLTPPEYKNLLNYKIGLTDLVKNKSGMDAEISSTDFGDNILLDKICKYQPKILCFNGKRAAKEFLLKKKVEHGLQKELIGKTEIFVAPSTSGAANRWWNIESWQELAKLSKNY